MDILDKPLVNRVAESGLITLNLEDFFPKEEVAVFDIKDYLFMGLILKEKDFREACKNHDWAQYGGKHLVIDCTADAIIPVWAYMLVTVQAAPFAKEIFQGNTESFYKTYYAQKLADFDATQYEGKRVVIKGCSDKPVPPAAYVNLTHKLQPFVQSIMYGEPCSTVPIFKRPRVVEKQE
ncbi:MAG: DUF2480 family protein [Saprospiraceae bacterium]|nr:DUF2480 family protein [Saprospiraceae bacterium]